MIEPPPAQPPPACPGSPEGQQPNGNIDPRSQAPVIGSMSKSSTDLGPIHRIYDKIYKLLFRIMGGFAAKSKGNREDGRKPQGFTRLLLLDAQEFEAIA